MMFGVHSGEKIAGCFMLRFGLAASPVHEEAVAESAKHAHHPHRPGFPDSALIVQVGNVQALMQSAFDAPSGPVISKPLLRVELGWGQTGNQSHCFRPVVTQVAAEQSDLFDAGQIDLFGSSWERTQGPDFELPFVELTRPGQGRRRVLREKKAPAERGRVSQYWPGWWAGCL